MTDQSRRQFIADCVAGALASGLRHPLAALGTPAGLPEQAAGDSSADVINPPKGGGALRGIGEKFSPDLFTGTGNYSLPLELPEGRNGFQPALSLAYSSGHGNSPFGLGWSLSTPSITRKTSKGTPRYHDDEDVFVFAGDDLVPFAQSGTLTEYKMRTEGQFARVMHFRDDSRGVDFWEVRNRDGTVSIFGMPNPPSLAPGWIDPAVITHPDEPQRRFSWKLTETRDPFGNRIIYGYSRDLERRDGARAWDQLYLSRIRYVDLDNGNDNRFLVEVALEYVSRPDVFSEYRAGFEIRTKQRCRRIVVYTGADSPERVRSYELKYLDEIQPADAPSNGVSLLAHVALHGYDDGNQRTEQLPAILFGYTKFDPASRRFQVVTGPELPTNPLGDRRQELVDVFGSGMPDIIQMDGTARYWRNLGEARFDRPRLMVEAPLHRLGDPGVGLLDANGDGRAELVLTSPGFAGFYPLTRDGTWDKHGFQKWDAWPSIPFDDPHLKLVDLDGDGITDALRSGSSLECYFNDPKRGWVGTARVPMARLEDLPNVDLADPRVRLADMTGDGLADLVLIHDGRIDYWPALGRGEFAGRVTMTGAPRFPYGYDQRQIFLGDVDGDGVADLIFVGDNGVTLWINQSGNSWSAPTEILGTPRMNDFTAVRLVDLKGNGVAGVLWSRDDSPQRDRMFFLDLMGGKKPYLLSTIDNGVGAETAITYEPSTRHWLRDFGTALQWKSPLPFPVHVVARVDFIDRVSRGRLTSTYEYHHGYWDGAEREFRGFGRVDQRDAESFSDYQTEQTGDATLSPLTQQQFSPATETRTWFHLGPVGEEHGPWSELSYTDEFWNADAPAFDPSYACGPTLAALPRRAQRDAIRALRGQITRTELYSLDGSPRAARPFTVTEKLIGVRLEVAPGSQNHDVGSFFPFVLAERHTQWERGDDPMTRVTFTGDHDTSGQARLQLTIGVPRARTWRQVPSQSQPALLATMTVSEYASQISASTYMVDRLVTQTQYEIVDDGRATAAEPQASALGLWERALGWRRSGQAMRCAVVAQQLRHYDGADFVGLPLGQADRTGALKRVEQLVLTESLLHDAYRSGSSIASNPEEPCYLTRSGSVTWPSEYPPAFRQRIASHPAPPPYGSGVLGGYVFHAGDSARARGFFAVSVQRAHDVRGLLTAYGDQFGHKANVYREDGYGLRPTKTVDAKELTTLASYDPRTLQPASVTDPNGSVTQYAYTPLGLLASVARLGRPLQAVGDDVNTPSTRFQYDLGSFRASGQPVSVHTIRRTHHSNDPDDRAEIIESREYSDGFGRVIQVRTQAEDVLFGGPLFGDGVLPSSQNANSPAIGRSPVSGGPPNVVVNGWQMFDNKGRVLIKYEPFFSTGWAYEVPAASARGASVAFTYDALGRIVQTLNPDGSLTTAFHGRCPASADVTTPERFEPSPWETYEYDANDNAARTPLAGGVGNTGASHHNTPNSFVVDALGRIVARVRRNSTSAGSAWYRTQHEYDIRGNLTRVHDEAGRVAATSVFDLANREIRSERIDSGATRLMLDAAGRVIERRDARGALLLHARDALNRLTHVWARDAATAPVGLRERIIHGDDTESALTTANAAGAHLLGRPYKHYDGAGLLTVTEYDQNGLPREKRRQIIAHAQVLAGWAAASNSWQIGDFLLEWEPPSGSTLDAHAATLLDPVVYQTSQRYDALGRVKWTDLPADVNGSRQRIVPTYNRAGALRRLVLGSAVFVYDIAYNAKGQRTLVVYGTRDTQVQGPRIMTRYAYDDRTLRLLRIRTEPFTSPDTVTFVPSGSALQDVAFEYDLTGNIVKLHDKAPNSGVASAASLDRVFTYDPLYRLLSATGRETDTPLVLPWDPDVRSQDPTRTRGYKQLYSYDPLGNLKSIEHQLISASGTVPTRYFDLAPGSNRLGAVRTGSGTGARMQYSYDAAGNLTQENTERRWAWDVANRPRSFRTQTGTSEPSVFAQYLYDALGQRVMKVVRKQGGNLEITSYIDGALEHTRLIRGNTVQEFNRIGLCDNEQRAAEVRVGNDPDDSTPGVRFQVGDQTGSVALLVSNDGLWINREEYTPYGTTSFGSTARKRYRFTGKERDLESGLSYHSARYYAPWLGRWISPDPAGFVDGLNRYQYARGRPLSLVDRSGLQAEPLAGAPASASDANQSSQTKKESPPADNTSPNWKGDSILLENRVLFDAIKQSLSKEARDHIRFRPFSKKTRVDATEAVFARGGAGFLQIDADYQFKAEEFAGRMLKEINDSGLKISVEFADAKGDFPAQRHERVGAGLKQQIKTKDVKVNMFQELAAGALVLSKNLMKSQNLGSLVAIGADHSYTTPESNWTRAVIMPGTFTASTVMHEVLGHFYLAMQGPNWKHGQTLAPTRIGNFPPPPNMPTNRFIDAVEQFAR